MFVNFPDPRALVQKLNVDKDSTPSDVALESALRDFQSKTIMEVANVMDSVSLSWEQRNQPITPEDMRVAAQQLRVYASQIEQGEKP